MQNCKNGKHALDWNECGYGGGPTADVWCKRCKIDVQVPIEIYKRKVPYLYALWLLHNKDHLQPIFKDGKILNEVTFAEVRERLKKG